MSSSEPMRRETGEVTFLWDAARWQSDYLIGAAHKNFTQLFAFSPNHVEAAARLTPDVAHKLLDWLEHYTFPAERCFEEIAVEPR